MNHPVKVLMIEDSVSLSAVYQGYLADTGYQTMSVETLGAARDTLATYKPEIILLDIELPDGNGMDFLPELRELNPLPKVIVMTAFGTSDMAVEAINLGAFDFLTKPFDAARLKVTVNNAVVQLRLDQGANELARLKRDRYSNFIGKSMPMQTVYKTIDSLAASDATGFIVGESGTGKEVAAEAIHLQSSRKDNEFVAINCGAIPDELMESELFGHVKGSFTGASMNREGAASVANGGTLFLDEICEMKLDLQKKLLRFIQTGTFRKVGSNTLEQVDVRFVCATNRNPIMEVREGRFREDLFYRLHVIPVHMPPLRERGEDVLMLAEHFLGHYCQQAGKQFNAFTDDAKEAIYRYAWPGNVRQLQNAMQQIVVLHDGSIVEQNMLPESVTTGALEYDGPMSSSALSVEPEQAHVERREQVEPLWVTEKRAIESAIESCDGNIARAAGLLEIAPSTLYRKLQSWKSMNA